MAPLFQNSARYASSRLQGCYIPLKDGSDYIYVGGVSSSDGSDDLQGTGLVHGSGIEDCDERTYPFSDVELIVGPLGYINSTRSSSFNLIRKPKRQDWRAALRHHQLYKASRSSFVPFTEREFRWYRKGILDCLFNRYPSYEDALNTSENEGRNTAFSRNFMLSNSGRLFLFRALRRCPL